MRLDSLLLPAIFGGFTATAYAQSAPQLLNKNGCAACHTADRKLVGPSYKEIAGKYRGDAAAPTKLAAKVKAGSSGVWGQVPMPPNPQINDDDLKQIIAFILSSG
jgi:cytochrome c